MSNVIKLQGVRLSFPSLFEKASFNGTVGNKYEATFLIPKSDTATRKLIDDAIAELVKAESKKMPSADRICIRDGDDVEYEGYADHWSIKAANAKRPQVVNRDKTPIADEDDIIHAGDYVNAVIDFWYQDNKFGKRINANLRAVQFVKAGEGFGGGRVNAADEFDDIADEQDGGADDL